MRIVVTGATGFIGGRIADRLIGLKSYEVICPVRREPNSTLFDRTQASLPIGNLDDGAFAAAITQGTDALIHCAGLAGDWGSYNAFHQANVRLTDTLLKASKSNQVKRFINISSPSIYFDFRDQFDLTETDLPPRFSNSYARTKFEGEQLVRSANRNGGMETVSLRPRFVVGAGDHNILPRLIRLQKSGVLFQVGDGKNVVDVTSVSNLVDAVLLCLNAPSDALNGETYNITNGKPVRFWELVDVVLTQLDLSTERRRVPRMLLMPIAKLNEQLSKLLRKTSSPALLPIPVAVLSQSMTLNISKARSRLGYEPKQTTEDAIREFTSWWRQQAL